MRRGCNARRASTALGWLLTWAPLAGVAQVAPAPASEAPTAELEPGAPALATQRYRLGRSLYQAGKFAEAAREFEAALSIFPASAKLSYNRARSLERAERFAEAAGAYEDFVRKAPTDPDREALSALAEGLWQRAGYGRLQVVASPPEASIAVDGQPASPGARLETRLPAGAHEVRVEWPGQPAERRQVLIVAGQALELSVSPPPPAAPPAPVAVVSAPPPESPRALEAPAPEPAPRGRDARFYGGLAGLGVGGVGLALGVWAHLAAADAADEAGGLSPSGENDARYRSLVADSESDERLSWIGLGAGAALAAAGGALLYWSLSDSADAGAALTPSGVAFVW